MSVHVKVFGCRPLTNERQVRAAGVGKPPREETALWERRAVQQAGYGDLRAAIEMGELWQVVESGD